MKGRNGPILKKEIFVTAISARNKIIASKVRGKPLNKIVIGVLGLKTVVENERHTG